MATDRAAAHAGLPAPVRAQSGAAAPDRRRRGLGLPGPSRPGRARCSGPAPTRRPRPSASTSSPPSRRRAAPVAPVRSPRSRSAAPTATTTWPWCSWSASATASVTDFRRAGAALARATKDRASVVTTLAAIAPDEGLGAFVVGAMLGSFAFHWRSTGPKERPVARDRAGRRRRRRRRRRARPGHRPRRRRLALAGARHRARPTSRPPPGSPSRPSRSARPPASTSRSGTRTSSATEGFGGLLAVGGGSANPPRLIRMDYTPRGATRRTPTVVLVGKGITFDSGGLDIKPSEGMLTMKRDMSGGGAVIAAMAALRDVDCPVRVIGLVPAAENSVSGSAMRPGDVITPLRRPHLRGQQHRRRGPPGPRRRDGVRRLRARADGPGRHRHPDRRDEGGAGPVDRRLLRQPRGLAAQVEAAATASGENVWRMPLVADYEDKVTSKIADGDNAAGGAGRDHRRAVPPALRRRRAVGPRRLRLRRRVAGRPPRVDRRPERLRPAPAADLARLRRPAGRASPDAGPAAALTVRWSLADAPDGVEERAGDLRRRHLPRPLHRHGRAALQDLADGPRASGSRAATSSPPTRRARSSSGPSPRVPPRRRARRSSARRRS